ncbi:MAG: SpoIIE family protein phosphatase [Bacillota bacterium]|nr:SpoIIE family protein phosphatase [Bacillota bacterium]
MKKHCKREKLLRLKEAVLSRETIVCFLILLLSRVTIYGDIAPCGIAVSVAVSVGNFNPLYALFYVLGLLSAGVGFTAYLRGILSYAIFSIAGYFIKDILEENKKIIPAFASACVLIGGLGALSITGFSKEQIIFAGFDCFCTLIFSFALSTAIPVCFVKEKRIRVTATEGAAVFVLIMLLICSFSDVEIMGLISMPMVAMLIISMSCAYKLSATEAGVLGMFAGLFAEIFTLWNPAAVCYFGFASFFASAVKKYNKIFVPLVFILSVPIFYIADLQITTVNLYETIIASVIFMILPRKFFELVGTFTDEDRERLSCRQLSGKLETLSDTFMSLSEIFNNISDKDDTSKNRETLVKNTAESVCAGCVKRHYCWNSEPQKTYAAINTLAKAMERNGRAEPADLPYEFSKGCNRRSEIVDEFTRLYQLCRVDALWGSRIEEGRSAISGQMKSISGVFGRLAKEREALIIRDNALESSILSLLFRAGISVKDISAGLNGQGRLEVTLELVPCGDMGCCDGQLPELLAKATGIQMERFGLKNCEKCRLKFIELMNYKVEAKTAVFALDGKDSGDSYSMARLEDGRFVIVLSDGMGTGKAAALASKATVRLIVRLLSVGMDIEAAVNLINSVLINKGPDGPFATIDVCIIDLESAECSFVKNGASAGFILHADKTVTIIGAQGFPAGVLNQMTVDNKKFALKEDDILIMTTDGALDILRTDNNEEAFVKIITEFTEEGEAKLAEFLAKRIFTDFRKNIKDDITIITASCIKRHQEGDTQSKRRLQA